MHATKRQCVLSMRQVILAKIKALKGAFIYTRIVDKHYLFG